jgi:caffeoyl-CoA O-methyltransferase
MPEKIDSIAYYIEAHSTAEDPLLARINRETHLKVLNPRMISGPVQGKLLEFISRMIKPASILEIGTYTGYSAICLAKGLVPGGKLYTIEKNDELTLYPLNYFREAGFDDRIEVITGDAMEIIPSLPYTFDLVFIDGNKTEYIQYYQLVINKLKTSGFLIVDNVLWNGKVVENADSPDTETRSIISFNELISTDPRVENVILPLRDGISLIRKL